LSEQIKCSLKELSDSGVAVYFMHGNRDFLMGEQFANQCGGTLLDEDTIITVGNDRALLMHGDSLCTRDIEYMKARQLLRNPLWQADFLSKPMDARVAFAAQARSESQSSQQMKANDIMDVTQADVDSEMTKAGVVRLIHGHTHRPNTHSWEFNGEARERIVLGDWSDSKGWMIRWEAGELPSLESFEF
jgi:UDP-2,3-diacylglucosamine hydrolase